MHDDLVLLLVAACRLAFGDDDFTEHRTQVYPPPIDIPGIGRHQPYPDWACPEIDRETNRLIECAKTGKLTILAWRCGDKSGKFERIPPEFWRWNNWIIAINPPHEICKSYDPASPRGGSDKAEWGNPHVCRSDVERLIGEAHVSSEPVKDGIAAKRDAKIRAALAQDTRPGTNMPWDRFIPDLKKQCGANDQTRGFGDRQIQRLVAKMLKEIEQR